MKKLLLLMTLLMSITVFSQNSYDKTVAKTSEGVETVYNDGKQAVKTVYNDAKQFSPKITQSINQIAKGLKVGAESVWNVLVKQQLVWSICFLILTISAMFNWWMFYKRMYPKTSEIKYNVLERDIIGDIPNPNYNKYRDGDTTTIKAPVGKEQYNAPILPPSNDSSKIFHWLHCVICIILSYFSFIHFSDMLTGFINPEFGAMKNILDLALTLK